MASSWGNSWLRSWGNSWGSILTTGTRGGISPDDAKRYRDYLERLTGIRKPENVTQRVIEAVEVIKELPVKASVIKAIPKKREIDYALLDKEIALIQAYIDKMEQRALLIQEQAKQEEEISLLLLLT